ncbi:hypothetical protein BDQ17DRAFT_1431795 [Cyathus striatus]|nr:hypothetical protein BDQ17DRAFT_1431795 [Cyathus striatus]
MQFNKFTSIFALAFLVGVTAALPNPEPAKADYVTCPGTGEICNTDGFHCCGFSEDWQSCSPIGVLC